jgi:hypothetical protein
MFHRDLPRTGKFAAVLAVMALVGAFGAGAGVAGTHGQDPPTCTVPTATSQPFLPWHDGGQYFLAPGGSFEGQNALDGWSTQGGASIVSGNESYDVGSATDGSSLYLPAGSSATTAPICVSIFSPDLRFFLKSSNSWGWGGHWNWSWSTLQVYVNFTDRYGRDLTVPVAGFSGDSHWSVSPQILFLNFIAPIVGSHWQTPVSFTFVPSGPANWWIDDLYVDPLKSQ